MKKLPLLLCVLLAAALLFAACSDSDNPSQEESPIGDPPESTSPVAVEQLSLVFAPVMGEAQILEAAQPLKQLLTQQLAQRGFDVAEVEITVADSFGAVGEAVAAGSADIGFAPASVYAAQRENVELLLTATRYDFNRQGQDPMDWNTGETQRDLARQVTGFPGLIYAGPSPKGKELYAKVEAGESLTWEDLDSAVWAVAEPTSEAGYLYPALWLRNTYGKLIADLSNVRTGLPYGEMFAQAAAGKIDVFVCYADGRSGYVDPWVGELGRTESIWDEVKVIALTHRMMNDGVIGSPSSAAMQLPGFPEAFCQAMQAVAETEEGFAAIQTFSHAGYLPGTPSDYDTLRDLEEIAGTLE